MSLADFERLSVLYCISPGDLFMSLLSSADSKFPDFPFVHVVSLLFWHTHKNSVVPLNKSLDQMMFWIALQLTIKLPNFLILNYQYIFTAH